MTSIVDDLRNDSDSSLDDSNVSKRYIASEHEGWNERTRGQRNAYGTDDQYHVDDEEDDFMKKIYDSTIEGACHGTSLPTICQIRLEDQLDVLTNCRQPLSFLSFFHEHNTPQGVGVEVLPAGAYVVPTFCEYCGSAHISQCGSNCRRPKLYFQKKRPPFQPLDPEKWDPRTSHAIIVSPNVPSESTEVPTNGTSWVSGLF